MASTFQLSILTPERSVFEGAVEYLQAPGSQGYLGVLAHHAGRFIGSSASLVASCNSPKMRITRVPVKGGSGDAAAAQDGGDRETSFPRRS